MDDRWLERQAQVTLSRLLPRLDERFNSGRFPGSFARGLPFQENPQTGDVRITGTCASLAGLEKALKVETDREVDLAIRFRCYLP